MRFAVTALFFIGALGAASSSVGYGQAPPGGGSSTARLAASPGPAQRDAGAPDVAEVVATYCGGCHNGAMRSASGALLDQFDTERISANPDAWSRAYRQLQAGTMPPVGARRPGRAVAAAVLASIESALGAALAPPASASSGEIAERLAALLWNSAPDAELRRAAQRSSLTGSAALERQVRRMLEDDRARTFVARFFFPWLGLDRLALAQPDQTAFPEFTVSLRDSMAIETQLFLLSQLREDRDPVELWSADYTFLNETLARHYGVPNVAGTEFRRVRWPGPERAGLLGQGSIHMATSRHRPGDPPHTSPASRAMWVRLRFLGAPSPRPFPGAQPVNPELPITPQTRTLPAQPCATCHQNFFPLGYALENFDPIGRWRTRDQAGPVDASGTFVDGTPTNGVVQLREVLLQRPDAFRTTIVEQLVLHASGRSAAASTASPESLVRARQVLRSVQTPRWSSLVASIVAAKPLAE